jgi:two-component sensor histidine kinase
MLGADLIRRECEEKTDLTRLEIEEIVRVAEQLQVMADLYGSDVFIDCLLRGRTDQAVVIAQAKPNTGKSLYSEFIVGQRILRDNEPGVFYSFATGKYVTGTRAITNEKVTIQQKVLPIRYQTERVIGVIILEQDISSQVIHEQAAKLFQQTAEDLGETLWEVAVAETNLPSLIHEGVILCNSEYLFTYINPTARQWFEKLNQPSPEIGEPLDSVFSGALKELFMDAHERGVEAREFTFGNNTVLVKAICIRRGSQFKGVLMLLSDITELREKEKQLIIKSAVIKEIHHRVKNNLQTISSLLRLQMRRTKSEDIRRAFQDSIHRIKTIALVHETLSQTGIDFIELHQMIDRVVSMLIQTVSSPEKKIRYVLEMEPILLPSAKATPVALILNELVQNCLDHGFEHMDQGEIRIQARIFSDELQITVQDDGCGFDPATVPEDTLGTRIIRTLVEEDLNGQIWYEISSGTKVTFRFPCASHVQV